MRTWMFGALEVACAAAIAVGFALIFTVGVGLVVAGGLGLGLLFIAQLPAPTAASSVPAADEPAQAAT